MCSGTLKTLSKRRSELILVGRSQCFLGVTSNGKALPSVREATNRGTTVFIAQAFMCPNTWQFGVSGRKRSTGVIECYLSNDISLHVGVTYMSIVHGVHAVRNSSTTTLSGFVSSISEKV